MLQKSLQLYREAYSGHPQEVWVLSILTLINRMGTMVVPFLAVYLTTVKGFSLEQAGYLMACFGLGSLAGSYIGGKLSDSIGAKKVMTWSLLISGFFLISIQWADSFAHFATLIFLTALFGDAFRPSFMAYLGSFVSKDQTARTMALIRLAINLGMTAAPMIGGFLATGYGYKWLFWIDGLTCSLASLYFMYASRNWQSKQSVPQREGEKKESQISESLPPYRNQAYMLFLLSTFLMGFCFIQWFHTVPVFLKTNWGFDERIIGIMMGFNCITISLIEMPIVHVLEQKSMVRIAILLGLVCFALCFVPFLFSGAIWLCFVAILLFTFGEIFFLPFNNAIPFNVSNEDNRGSYMSWYWMTWSLTAILGPFIGLNFSGKFGFTAFWILAIIMTGISIAMNLFWRGKMS
ncbi:MAG: MFS transporter [Bacteroidota bacterium]